MALSPFYMNVSNSWVALKCPAMVGSVYPAVLCPYRCAQDSSPQPSAPDLQLAQATLFLSVQLFGLFWTNLKAQGLFCCSHTCWEPGYSIKHSFHLLLGFSNLSLEFCHSPTRSKVQGLAFRDFTNSIFYYLSPASFFSPEPQETIPDLKVISLFLVFTFLQ